MTESPGAADPSSIPRRWRGVRCARAVARLGHDAARAGGDVAGLAEDRGDDLPRVPVRAVPVLGPGVHHDLQRRLRADARPQAPRDGGAAGDHLAGDLGPDRADAGRCRAHRDPDVARGPDAGARAQRHRRGRLLHLLVQPRPRRVRRGRRGVHRGARDDGERGLHAAPADDHRPRRADGGPALAHGGHRGGDRGAGRGGRGRAVRALDASRPGRASTTSTSRGRPRSCCPSRRPKRWCSA